MNCDQAQKKIDAYVDGELPEEGMRKMEAHLATCGSCRREVALSHRITDLNRSFPSSSPRDLRHSIAGACEKRPVSVSTKTNLEIVAMKKGIRIGLVTAAVAAAIGFLTLYPRPANAAVMWAEMAKASQGIRAVHIVNVWYLQNGEKGRTEIWTDGHEIRIEPSKTQLLTGEEAGVQESTEVFATSNGIDPATFMVSEQIKMLGAGAHEPEDRGTIKQGRKTYRMISIVNQRGDMRHTFWVDEGSDLPVRKVDDEWSNGKWVEVGYQSFEFMDSMPSKNPPPAKKG